jgi:hypothetical protein
VGGRRPRAPPPARAAPDPRRQRRDLFGGVQPRRADAGQRR